MCVCGAGVGSLPAPPPTGKKRVRPSRQNFAPQGGGAVPFSCDVGGAIRCLCAGQRALRSSHIFHRTLIWHDKINRFWKQNPTVTELFENYEA